MKKGHISTWQFMFKKETNKKKNNGRKCKISGGSALPLDTLILSKQIAVL